jgi:hypothetical protein
MDLPALLPDGTPTTVGELIERAQSALALANRVVQENALLAQLSSFMMKQEKRRGTPTIFVRLDGTVALRVSYGSSEETGLALAEGPGKLPSLDALRARATAEGVDISDLGRQKRKILARLRESSTPGLVEVPATR